MRLVNEMREWLSIFYFRTSEERGWELLWLAAGLFPCSQILQKEINMFLRSRLKRWPIASDIQQRLYKSAQ